MEKPLYTLLCRAVDDEGPEGSVAFEMFRKRVKGKKGSLYFLSEEDEDSPLMFVIADKKRQIEELTAEVKQLKNQFGRVLKIAEKVAA
jgi:hypothetical protein